MIQSTSHLLPPEEKWMFEVVKLDQSEDVLNPELQSRDGFGGDSPSQRQRQIGDG